MMPLRVSDAIRSIADDCNDRAARIAVDVPPSPGSPLQPSVAAMAASHAAAQALMTTLTARLLATSGKLSQADRSYDLEDESAAFAIAQRSV